VYWQIGFACIGCNLFRSEARDDRMTPVADSPSHRRVTFAYLGRNPAFATFVFEFARVAVLHPGLDCELLVTDGTELAHRLHANGIPTFALPTRPRLPIGHVVLGYFNARRHILQRLETTRPQAVVTLMPHVWSPLLAPQIKRRGILYATIIHDATPHPGDPTAWATRWLATDATHADVTIALSQSVAEQLRTRVRGDRITTLFHPDIGAAGPGGGRPRSHHRPFRLLFFGRILAYKGLPILIEAVERLRAQCFPIDLGVAGAGDVTSLRPRLEALGAQIIDRWVPPDELSRLLADYDAMACSHVEASQSGVAALAFANGMPVIATPVGGLTEQVVEARTGILARDLSAEAFADAIRRLMTEEGLYEAISANLIATANDRSMSHFLERVLAALRVAEPSRRVA
jgi:glycosyltransferase involved in cell wall biosynthesis